MYLLRNVDRCFSRTVILNRFWTNNFSLHKDWFPTCVFMNNWNLVRKEPYSICVWYSRINYTDVTCQWSIVPFVRDLVVDGQSGFLGKGTGFYSMQNFESTPLETQINKNCWRQFQKVVKVIGKSRQLHRAGFQTLRTFGETLKSQILSFKNGFLCHLKACKWMRLNRQSESSIRIQIALLYCSQTCHICAI